jgi:hypothetical protein
MSEPFIHFSGDFDYWMGVDLLDACYDPVPAGMDLGGGNAFFRTPVEEKLCKNLIDGTGGKWTKFF